MSTIKIEIKVGANENDFQVNASGSADVISLSAEELGLTDKILKSAIALVNAQEFAPNVIHYNHPLHKENDLPLPTRHIKVLDIAIDSIEYKPTVLKTTTFDNSGNSDPATYNASMTEVVTQTVGSSWSNGGSTDVKLGIQYDIGFGVSADWSTSYSEKWDKGHSHSKAVALTSASGVRVTVQPGDKKIATLSAQRGTLKVRVRYLTTYHGVVIGEYLPGRINFQKLLPFGVERLYFFDEEEDAIITTETIEIGFYSKAHVMISDA